MWIILLETAEKILNRWVNLTRNITVGNKNTQTIELVMELVKVLHRSQEVKSELNMGTCPLASQVSNSCNLPSN